MLTDTCVAIGRPALNSALVSLVVEVPICIFLSLWGMKGFARYLSDSEEVAGITQKMWRVRLSFLLPPHPLLLVQLTHDKKTEHRLVLHLLRNLLSILRYSSRHCSPLVPLPSSRLKFLLDASLGNCHDS